MQDTDLLSKIINLKDGWYVNSVEIDRPSNRIDIQVDYKKTKKKFFFGRKHSQDNVQKLLLRHLPIAGMRTFLHVPFEGNYKSAFADSNAKYTKEMESFLIELLTISNSNQTVSKASGIPTTEIRKLSERTGIIANNLTDRFSKAIETPQTPTHVAMTNHLADTFFELIEHPDIPNETDECWQRIINNETLLQTDAVSLQMLLQRIRQAIMDDPSEIVRIKSAKLLRQYFIKNQYRHKDDLKLITSQHIQMHTDINPTQSGKVNFPDDNHAIWQKIINGERAIQTSNIALQMMMKQVRRSIKYNSSEISRQAGTKILRHFFIRHQNHLSAEIQQLGIDIQTNVDVDTDTVTAVASIPAENQPCWQKLISGELKFQTNAIGLQMMLKRICQSIEKNRSELNRMAGIKILRQYFIKYQNLLENEIIQLHSPNDVMAAKSNGYIIVPSETHPNWQKLINGELILDTKIIALNMMLQSLRISIEKNPTDAARYAAIKILRKYFIKYQNKHKTELNQLIAA